MCIEFEPPEAGAPQVPLNRALVLRTALEIVDCDGVAGLSMSRLCADPGRDPMSFYRCAANKAALDGVVELVLEHVSVDTSDDDWESRLGTLARTYRRAVRVDGVSAIVRGEQS